MGVNPNAHYSLFEKILLNLELILIIAFLSLIILNLIMVMTMYNNFNDMSNKYFFYSIMYRINPKYYHTNQTLVNTMGFTQCDGKYTEERSFMDIASIYYADFIWVTEETNVYENSKVYPGYIQNSTMLKYEYFHFELQKPGDYYVNLQTAYKLTSWRKKTFCDTKVIIQNSKAFAFIDKTLSCSEALKNTRTVDCSVYKDTYRLCLVLDYLQLDDGYTVVNASEAVGVNYAQLCPYSYYEISKTASDNQDSFYVTALRKNQAPSNVYGDQYLMKSVEKIYLDTHMVIKSPLDTFTTSIQEKTSLRIGQYFGFSDPFTVEIDSYPFVEMYNDTFFKEKVETGQTITYEPEYMNDGLNEFIIPIDSNTTKYQAHLTVFAYEAISEQCYKDFIVGKNHREFFTVFDLISFESCIEITSTIVAWLFVLLFIAVFWNLLIRFNNIRSKLKKTINDYDLSAEDITKYTGKCLEIIAFLLVLFGAFYQDKNLENVKTIIDDLVKDGCFTNQLVLDVLKEYKAFAETQSGLNDSLIAFTITSMIIECTAVGLYLLLYLYKKKKGKDIDEYMGNKILKTD